MAMLLDKRTLARLRAFVLSDDQKRLNWAIVGIGVAVALVVGALLTFLTPVWGVAVMVAGVAGVLMLSDIRWGLFVLLSIVFLLPFASLPFKIGFTPTFLDLAYGALYLVWAIRLITRKQDDLVLTWVGVPVLVFIVLSVFSFVLGLKHSHPSSNNLRTFAEVLLGFALFFLALNNVREMSLLRQVTAAIVLTAAAESAVGILFYALPTAWTVRLLNPLARLQYPVGYGALRYIADDPDRPMRAIGTNVDPNILGTVLIIAIGIAVAQVFVHRPVLPRWMMVGALGLMGLCLFLTYSRGSMVGAAVAVGFIALLRYRRLLPVMLLAMLLLLVLPQTQAYVSHFAQGIQIQDLSTLMRMGEYKDTIKLIMRYPWLGVGFVGTPDIDLYVGVASVYFKLAAQMGVVGLIAFLGVMGAFMWHIFLSWRKLPSDSPLSPFVLGYWAAVVGSLVAAVLDHTLLTYPHAVALFWLVLGLGVAATRLESSRSDIFTKNSRNEQLPG
ncbi:MAG: O-antigen ligase family protein [Anaerolineae bacterium]|nr:O-antigen ligase family protein [Anaerolineae bacterium]